MINIRSISKGDLPKVASIAQRTWPTTFAGILTPEQIDYMLKWMYDPATLESQFNQGHTFLLAEEDGRELGFAAYELNYAGGNSAKLHKIYILPSAQGKGAGKALILRVTDAAKAANQRQLLLNVNKHNQKAITFYQRFGFKELRPEIIDIGHGYVMDDLVMELPLEAIHVSP